MSSKTVDYFKCIKCGEINTISNLNKVEESIVTWSLLSFPSIRRKFNAFAARHGLTAGDALAYLLTLEYKESEMKEESSRFGVPSTFSK